MAKVLPPQIGGRPCFEQPSLRKLSVSYSSFFANPDTSYSTTPESYHVRNDNSYLHSSLTPSAPPSPTYSKIDPSQLSVFVSSSASSSSLDSDFLEGIENMIISSYMCGENLDSDEDLDSENEQSESSYAAPTVSCPTAVLKSCPEPCLSTEDDMALKHQPSRHVDYLSHEWFEEDIWLSWRHIVSKRKEYGEWSRLENASWRTWAKYKYGLKTTCPKKLNWLKEGDVTWLYGPLQTSPNNPLYRNTLVTINGPSNENPFSTKKSILKKRSVFELMLPVSISTSSLAKRAASSVQAQQRGRCSSDSLSSYPCRVSDKEEDSCSYSNRSTSGLQTPEQSEGKCIRFDNKVEQFIAVNCKGAEDQDSLSDDDVLMMRPVTSTRFSKIRLLNNDAAQKKNIAKLPSTTLKNQTDLPDVARNLSSMRFDYRRLRTFLPSSSQETAARNSMQ